MKGLNIVLLVCFAMLLGSCCSKKGACPLLEFSSFDLANFESNEVTDSVNLIRYKGGTNFTTVLDTSFLKASPTDDPKVFRLTTSQLSLSNDYAVQVVKLKKVYKVGNYTTEKITCGKCFMRSNNQFGYQLTGYTVNNAAQTFENTIRIFK